MIFILLQDSNIIFLSILGRILPKHILNLRINILFGGNVYHHKNENRITQSRYIAAGKHAWVECGPVCTSSKTHPWQRRVQIYQAQYISC